MRCLRRRDARFAARVIALGVFTALASAARPAVAQGDEPTITETACVLPHFEGKIVSSVSPVQCGAVVCTSNGTATLENSDGEELFAVQTDTGDELPPPPELVCENGGVALRWLGQALHFELHRGELRLSFVDRRRAATLWQAPVARTPEALETHASFRAVLALALDGVNGSGAPNPDGLDEELVQIAELVSLRDRLRAGDFEDAAANLAALEGTQMHARKPSPRRGDRETPLPPALFAHVVELHHELDANRRRTLPFSLGARRFVGGAPRALRAPLDLGEPPELFFRGSMLCVADLEWGRPIGTPPSTSRMRCFAPDATKPSDAEPLALPASSANHLAYTDFTSIWNRCRAAVTVRQKSTPAGANVCDGGPGIASQDLLAVIDGDAMLALADGGLELVRGPGQVEKVSPAEARTLVARSAGTSLYARTASYFLERGRVVQVAGSNDKTWDLLGKPPAGAFWIGTPLVSPDQRWVVAQSGNGGGPVALWVFPIVR